MRNAPGQIVEASWALWCLQTCTASRAVTRATSSGASSFCNLLSGSGRAQPLIDTILPARDSSSNCKEAHLIAFLLSSVQGTEEDSNTHSSWNVAVAPSRTCFPTPPAVLDADDGRQCRTPEPSAAKILHSMPEPQTTAYNTMVDLPFKLNRALLAKNDDVACIDWCASEKHVSAQGAETGHRGFLCLLGLSLIHI